MTPPDSVTSSRAGTGSAGLDDVLGGGLPRREIFLLEGGPGTGKITLSLHFLMAGVANGEKVALITLAKTERALHKMAASHGWSLQGIDICDRRGIGERGDSGEQTLFRTADVELGETIADIIDAIERLAPDRLVLDSIAQLRLLADSKVRYQRELLALSEFFAKRSITVVLLDGSGETLDRPLADLCHGVIRLEQAAPEYGNVRRRLTVVKMRGISYDGGYHNFRIITGALEVFPRIKRGVTDAYALVSTPSGVDNLDKLVGGGLDEGTACLLVGAAGTGKSSVATLYALAAARRGGRAALFSFDERAETFFIRARSLGMDLDPYVEQGLITFRAISTSELSPGEFAQIVRDAVDKDQAKVVLIDSLTGYFHAMPQESALLSQMHDLLAYLSHNGVLSLLIVSQHGMIGETLKAPVDVSYMADTVILFRLFEAFGQVRKAISVIKKRLGPHESTIRELKFAPGSLHVGDPIEDFDGVLTGRPTFRGASRDVG